MQSIYRASSLIVRSQLGTGCVAVLYLRPQVLAGDQFPGLLLLPGSGNKLPPLTPSRPRPGKQMLTRGLHLPFDYLL